MNFFQAIGVCFVEKYATFKGRALRSEYWFFFLACTILDAVALVIDKQIATDGRPLLTIVSILTLVPSLAVSARRLHDVNRSGWWILIYVTVIGLIPLLYWYCKKSDESENNYGPVPNVL
jgi:uncharacterized membrane protein YhaH (DUF805 family)